MSTLRITNIEAKADPSSPTVDEKIKLTNSNGDILVHIDGKTSGITTIGINTTAGNIKFDQNSNVVVTGIITATKFVGTIEPTTLTVGGDLTIPDKIVHTGDTNTSIRFPAADTITAETAGSERLRVTSAGLVGINTNSPDGRLHVFEGLSGTVTANGNANDLVVENSGTGGISILTPDANHGYIIFGSPTSNEGAILRYRDADNLFTIGTEDADGQVVFRSGAGTERLRIDSSGNLNLVSSSSSLTDLNFTASDLNVYARVEGGKSGSGVGDLRFHTYSGGLSEAARIDSSGRLLVGTTSADSNTRLHVSAAENTSDPMATDASIVIANTQNAGNNEAAALKFNVGNTNTASISAHYDSFNAGVNSSLRFYTQYQSAFNSPAERMRITSAGKVQITGTRGGSLQPSDNDTLELYTKATNGNVDTGCGLTFYNNDGNGAEIGGTIQVAKENGNINNTAGYMRFSTRANNSTPAERMRISSGGVVLIGKTAVSTNTDGVELQKESNVIGRINLTKSYSGTANAVACFHTSTYVGGIQYANSSVNFYNASDYRLKENVVDLDGAITRIKQLSPKRFNYIAEASNTVDGFLAHEAQTVVPEAVSGTHNEVDENGDPVIQCIDQSKLVPLLTAALQEAIAEIETLKTKVAALEG